MISGRNIDDSNFEQIILPANEYAHVVSEINTNLTNEEQKKNILVKPVGD